MKPQSVFVSLLLAALAVGQLAMSRNPAQYDEDARELERQEKEIQKHAGEKSSPMKRMASGVKEVAVDSPKGLVKETTVGTTEEAPIVGTLKGVQRGAGQAMDKTVKGAVKVATLGYGEVESYKVVEPEAGTDEPTKYKFKF